MAHIHTTCIEMFEQRNYEILETEEDHIIAMKPDGERIIAYFFLEGSFDKDRSTEYILNSHDQGINHLVIIYRNISSSAKNICKDSNKIIELFHLQEFFNPTKNILVPLHERLEDEQADIYREKYGSNLPVIKTTDKIARFYNFNLGDIIKITRNNGYIAFRIVQ